MSGNRSIGEHERKPLILLTPFPLHFNPNCLAYSNSGLTIQHGDLSLRRSMSASACLPRAMTDGNIRPQDGLPIEGVVSRQVGMTCNYEICVLTLLLEGASGSISQMVQAIDAPRSRSDHFQGGCASGALAKPLSVPAMASSSSIRASTWAVCPARSDFGRPELGR